MQGEVFGLPQNKANQWIHTLLPVLQKTLQRLGDAPARTMQELAERLQLHTLVGSSVEPEALSTMVALSVDEPVQASKDTETQEAQESDSNPSPLFVSELNRATHPTPASDADEQKSH